MTVELKPCPFCGGGEIDSWSCGMLECAVCGARSGRYDTINDARAAWSHRPGEDALQARVDALEWLREVEGYVIEHEHPVCMARGNSSKRGEIFDAASCEYDAIHRAARAAVEGK